MEKRITALLLDQIRNLGAKTPTSGITREDFLRGKNGGNEMP